MKKTVLVTLLSGFFAVAFAQGNISAMERQSPPAAESNLEDWSGGNQVLLDSEASELFGGGFIRVPVFTTNQFVILGAAAAQAARQKKYLEEITLDLSSVSVRGLDMGSKRDWSKSPFLHGFAVSNEKSHDDIYDYDNLVCVLKADGRYASLRGGALRDLDLIYGIAANRVMSPGLMALGLAELLRRFQLSCENGLNDFSERLDTQGPEDKLLRELPSTVAKSYFDVYVERQAMMDNDDCDITGLGVLNCSSAIGARNVKKLQAEYKAFNDTISDSIEKAEFFRDQAESAYANWFLTDKKCRTKADLKSCVDRVNYKTRLNYRVLLMDYHISLAANAIYGLATKTLRRKVPSANSVKSELKYGVSVEKLWRVN